MKKLMKILLVFTILALMSSCTQSKIIAYDFRADYVNNTVETKIITNKDTLMFGDLTKKEFEEFIRYYISTTYRSEDQCIISKE